MDIAQSLHRILNSQDVLGELFYDVFLAECPEAKAYFDGVDLPRQAVLVTMALVVVEQYYSHAYPATETYLRYLGSKHCDWNIPMGLFTNWSDAMLSTLQQFHGTDWDEALSRQWTEALARTREQMLEGYRHHFTL